MQKLRFMQEFTDEPQIKLAEMVVYNEIYASNCLQVEHLQKPKIFSP